MWKLRAEEDVIGDCSPTVAAALNALDRFGGTLAFTHMSALNDGLNILGINPVIEMTESGIRAGNETINADVFSAIASVREINRDLPGDMPLLFGTVGYDALGHFEEPGVYPALSEGVSPDIRFVACEHVYIWRNGEGSILRHVRFLFPFQYNSVHGDDILRVLRTEESLLGSAVGETVYAGTTIPRDNYEAAVSRIVEEIRAGEVYQVNLSRRIDACTTETPCAIAKKLCVSNEIEFGAVARTGNRWMISTSPERFFRIQAGRITASPIKGTAARGKTPEEDAQLLAALLADPKEQAELSMITDLLRNDLSRICVPGTVQVDRFSAVKTLRNVHHLYADISGDLVSEDLKAVFSALFPGGSISGCPKIAACSIIAEEEKAGRGLYTGTYGYICADGSMDFNILIRTVMVEGADLHFNVGGGITVLSHPAAEWQETVDKAAGITAALDMQEYRE